MWCRGRSGGSCFGLLAASSTAYLVGLWQGAMLCGKFGKPESLGGSAEPMDGDDAPKSFDSVSPTQEEVSLDEVSSGEHKEALPLPTSNEGDAEERVEKGCRQFETVAFPLDGWPTAVRAESGQSLYGTGWAQQLLRSHQFPENCSGRNFVEHGMFQSGMGSNMHIGAAVLAFALNENSIYLWPEDDVYNPWTVGSTSHSVADCPNGRALRNYECYLKPVSSCKANGGGSRYVGMKRERGKKKIPGTDLVPRVFKTLLKCSGYPSNYWPKWWRAQATAFFLRPNQETALELQRFRESHLVNQMQDGVLGCYVRHGDKYYEASEYPFKDYLRIFSWILDGDKEVQRNCPGASKLLEPFKWQLPRLRTDKLYLGSDDAAVVEEARHKFGEKLIWMNVSRLSKRMSLMKVSKALGAKEVVMESLLNLQLLMESDAFLCTWTSNWCRLVDEMRMTAGTPVGGDEGNTSFAGSEQALSTLQLGPWERR
ncbi:unnamed protein product [Durusdinium trenchii]|uniref:Uncharacterized protein n=1 Tax=Durusdinium trenchii TaxID=1381693 RepID=A0ABP0RZ45_9DINO